MTLQEVTALRSALAAAQAESAKLKESLKNQPRGLTLKVSTKGAVSVYGMGRFPVTLYAQQWTRLLDQAPALTQFIAANKHALVTKDQQP